MWGRKCHVNVQHYYPRQRRSSFVGFFHRFVHLLVFQCISGGISVFGIAVVGKSNFEFKRSGCDLIHRAQSVCYDHCHEDSNDLHCHGDNALAEETLTEPEAVISSLVACSKDLRETRILAMHVHLELQGALDMRCEYNIAFIIFGQSSCGEFVA